MFKYMSQKMKVMAIKLEVGIGLQTEVLQVQDDMDLLRLMLDDCKRGPQLYQPTNYWAVYKGLFLPELLKLGLHDFRRRENSVLSSFGATDLMPRSIDLYAKPWLNNQYTRKIPVYPWVLKWMNNRFNGFVGNQERYGIALYDLKKAMYDYAISLGKKAGAKLPEAFSVSLFGNPEDILEVEGRYYTPSILSYYLRYVYCCNFIDFKKVKVMVELGCGSGKQIEVLKKLYPKMSFVLFDILPQLYVCEQYLKMVFPGDVVSFRDTREFEKIVPETGKIYIMGTAKFPLIRAMNVDLFWNAASFQEMEPEIVLNYLSIVNGCAGHVFLQEKMKGKGVSRVKGRQGVLERTTLEHYKQGLTNFTLVDISASAQKIGIMPEYSDSFWRRKKR